MTYCNIFQVYYSHFVSNINSMCSPRIELNTIQRWQSRQKNIILMGKCVCMRVFVNKHIIEIMKHVIFIYYLYSHMHNTFFFFRETKIKKRKNENGRQNLDVPSSYRRMHTHRATHIHIHMPTIYLFHFWSTTLFFGQFER